MEKYKLSMTEIAASTGESLPLIYRAVNCGDLRTFLVGRRRFARPADVRKWVEFLQTKSDEGHPLQYQKRPVDELARTSAIQGKRRARA